MAIQRYITPLFETLGALLIFLYIAVYGFNAHILQAFHGAVLLLWYTISDQHIYAFYYGVIPSTFWYSVRLILVGILFAVIGGMLFTIARIRLKAISSHIVENVVALFESIPEPMYVVIVVLITLYFIQNLGINLPVFIDGPPNWVDTLIPGTALALPAAFYLSRMMTLRILDEVNAAYAITAFSKGASHRRVFYRHILANGLPFLLRHLPVVSAIVISSEMFAEYMLEYRGAYYQFTTYGLGWGHKPRYVASYEPGYILVLGAVLVLLWLIIRLISNASFDALYQAEIQKVPWPQRRRVAWTWIITGIIFIGIIVVASVFPHLLTANSPTKQHLWNRKLHLSAPFPPSKQFPLGTDGYGRGLLSQTLHGTWATLWPAILCTGLVFLASLSLTTLTVRRPNGVLARMIRFLGTALSALPAFLVLLVVLHPRNGEAHQWLLFVVWIMIVEVGRSSYSFLTASDEWYQFSFVQGAISVGGSRVRILYTHLRGWLASFSLEYVFAEFSRILALMTMLSVFQIYAVAGIGYNPLVSSTTKVVTSLQSTWFSMLGDVILSGAYMSDSYLLYAPALALLVIMIGSNLIARGIRGQVQD